MKIFSILAAVLLIILTGCSITQEYHFNKDYSGSYRFEMNMGDMISMIQSMDTTGSLNSLDTLDQSFEQIRNQYNEAGAKNIEVGWKNDRTTISISFDFDNLEKLNEILANSNNEFNLYSNASTDEKTSFTKKGNNTLIMNFPESSKDTAILSSMEGMKDYLTIETIFSFDRTIKSVDNRSAKISEDGKSFKFEGKPDDFIKEGYTMDSQVKLKRK
jgi:hypothetical protein